MNYQKQYLKIVQAFVEKYKKDSNIIGITLNGGVARGTGDEYSEIDIHLYVKDKKDSNLPPRIGGVGNDVAINDVWFEIYKKQIDEFEKKKIGMDEKWDLANSKILFDRNNKIKKIIEDKIKLSDEEKEDIEEDYGFGSEWCLQLAEVFVHRKDLITANLMILRSLEYFVNYYFYLNCQLIPHFKWKFYYFQKLKRPKKEIKDFILEMMKIKKYSEKEVMKKIKFIRKTMNEELGREDDSAHKQDTNALKTFPETIQHEVKYSNPFE